MAGVIRHVTSEAAGAQSPDPWGVLGAGGGRSLVWPLLGAVGCPLQACLSGGPLLGIWALSDSGPETASVHRGSRDTLQEGCPWEGQELHGCIAADTLVTRLLAQQRRGILFLYPRSFCRPPVTWDPQPGSHALGRVGEGASAPAPSPSAPPRCLRGRPWGWKLESNGQV